MNMCGQRARQFSVPFPGWGTGCSVPCFSYACLHNRRKVFVRKRAKSMHSFARHFHGKAGASSTTETKGLIAAGGWRYDLMEWFIDTFMFRGQVRQLRQRTATLARMQPGEQVLDVGCGTGTLAIE